MNRRNWVCYRCRLARRSGPVLAPSCGSCDRPMVQLRFGQVPRRRDVKTWGELERRDREWRRDLAHRYWLEMVRRPRWNRRWRRLGLM